MTCAFGSGIEVPTRPENPEFVWKTAKAPIWVTCCVMGFQQALKNYGLIFPPAEAFSSCINPTISPLLGVLDYCALVYRIDDMKMGGESLKFKGNCATYHQACCCVQLKSYATCTLYQNCYGGNLVMPTYLDSHICEAKNAADFQPGNRWEDATKCKERFAEIKKHVADKGDPPFDEHMYLMQPVPNPPCCESMKMCCSSYGDQQMVLINNELRYTRIGHKQMRFTGDAAGFNATKLGCCAKIMCPCSYGLHKMLGTYNTAHKNYIDNHLEWLPEGHAQEGLGRDMAAGKQSAKVHPAPEETPAPGQQEP